MQLLMSGHDCTKDPTEILLLLLQIIIRLQDKLLFSEPHTLLVMLELFLWLDII